MLTVYFIGVIVTMLAIWKLSDYFENATEWIGRNLTDGVKGASLNAIASSMPELLTGFIFLFFLHGSDGYSGTIGTTAGSAVFNSLIIPGIVILLVTLFMHVKHIQVSRKVVTRDGFFLLFAEIVLIFVISTNRITWLEGGLLVLLYIVYIGFMFWKKTPAMDNVEEYSEDDFAVTGKKAWLWLGLSTLGMVLVCWALVFFVEQIGVLMEIELIFVSIILAAAASSVPDLFISLRDAKKGNYDDAVSNALGSNIFDICVAHGLPLFIYTLIYGDVIMSDSTTTYSVELRVWLLILTAATIVIYLANKKLGKWSGFAMIGLYALFILFVVGRVMDVGFVNEFAEMLNIFK